MSEGAKVIELTTACRDCGEPVLVSTLPLMPYRRGGELRTYRMHRCPACFQKLRRENGAADYSKHSTERKGRTLRRYRLSKTDPVRFLWQQVRQRARLKGIEFTIEPEDLFIPEHCPVLGIKLRAPGAGLANESPTVDRFDPAKGYVRGNVSVMSMKANRFKNNATLDDLVRLVTWMRAQGAK